MDKQVISKAIAQTEQKLGESPWYSVMHGGRFLKTFQLLVDLVPPGRATQIADIGVWPGYQSLALEYLGYDVIGFDLFPERLKKIPFPVFQQDLNAVPRLKAEPGSFDAIVATEIIEHLQPNIVLNFVTGLRETLRPDGWVLMTTPNRNSIGSRLRSHTHGTDSEGHGHTKEYTSDELRQLFVAGWKNVLVKKIEAYENVGYAGPDQYYRPLTQWWRHPRKSHNLIKIGLSILQKTFPSLRDTLVIMAQRNDNEITWRSRGHD